MHSPTCHASKHSPIALDLTSSLLYNKWAKYVHPTMGKWCCLSQPTSRETTIFCSLNFCLNLQQSTHLNMKFFTAKFAPTIQYPELLIRFNVIPWPPWVAILWWCWIMVVVTFLSFGNNIGCLQLLFMKELSSLPPTWMIPSFFRNGSKLKILLLLSSVLLTQVLSFSDFKDLNSSLKLLSAPSLLLPSYINKLILTDV